MTSASPVPGAALDLLPAGRLPGEFSWAAADTRIARALAARRGRRRRGGQVVTPRVRELVTGLLRAWDGRPPGRAGPGPMKR